MPEHQNIEYKQSWRDEYLKWICGFANAHGGKIFIGIDDKENVIGVDDYNKLLEDIPNKTVNHLGLVVDVNLHTKNNKKYIEISIAPSDVPVAYHGIYHYRSGSTKQELKGTALQQFILNKMGKSWEDIPVANATLKDLNETSINNFVKKAIEKGRIPADAANDDTKVLLKNLFLINQQDQLTNAALLLFGKDPAVVSLSASFKIGRFGKEDHDLKFQDIVETNIFEMPDKVLEILSSKYLIRPISYKGLERMEPLEYPESALREAILNAIIHKDYLSTWIFLRVYDDKLIIWNPGKLPEELTIEKLKTSHSSYPRNKVIANVFFKAGFIEAWGRGTNKIIQACIEAGLPEPLIEESQNGIQITFQKDIYTEEYLSKLDLNERQVKAILFVKSKGHISNSDYQKINDIGKSVAASELFDLTNKNFLSKIGATGRGIKYVLITSKK
ncbi:MAG: putative DNA binding domain-containing protein [Bacteroidota bacterium]|nr:putative DNA binding domain-containing protein [Bacteroidota bacterium]